MQAVEVAMADLGGQSIPYFIRLAALYSVAATVEMFRVPVVGRIERWWLGIFRRLAFYLARRCSVICLCKCLYGGSNNGQTPW